jgi:hypothetical protein
MDGLFRFLKKLHPIFRKDRRQRDRKSCFIECYFMVRGCWYKGSIQVISENGAYISSDKSREFSPGEDIFLVSRNGVLLDQLSGEIVRVGSHGMGVQFQTSGFDDREPKTVQGYGYISEKEYGNKGKIRRRKLRWEPSSTTEVIKYRLYWSRDEAVGYHSDHADLGNVTKVTLPDGIASFPHVSGKFELGVSAVSQAGNESDLIKTTVHFDFSLPEAPRNLKVEDT